MVCLRYSKGCCSRLRNGFEDGSYRPDAPLSRQEAALPYRVSYI
ncbi:S-layer homology domain-containing protein [Paenibacillus chitinolyticus]